MGKNTFKLVTAGLCLAMAILLPMVFAGNRPLSIALSPMHIPILICGFLCGWHYGLAVGALAPFMSFLLTGMPPFPDVGLPMLFELAVYGCAAAILCKLFPKKIGWLYASLVLSMVAGRLAWGLVTTVLTLNGGGTYSVGEFLQATVISTLPGIILHIVLIPPLVYAVSRIKILSDD